MGHNLLLADDSITIQKVVKIIFSGEFYDLTIVDNGIDALARAREAVPDIMLIDAVMPGKNGYEVCREARNDPALAAVPILLLTGVFEPFDEGKARESGADDFIAKPFESQVLMDKVRRLITLGVSRKATAPPVPEESPVPQPLPVAPDEVVEETPLVTMAPPVEEEPLLIEEVTSLDDPWGMGSVEADLEELPFAAAAVETEEELPVQEGPTAEEFAFEEDVEEQELSLGDPVPEELPEPEVIPSLPRDAVAREAVPLSEEQLVAALSTVSRELIQRIVWEVVPDLAESLIRDEIRKIREGV